MPSDSAIEKAKWWTAGYTVSLALSYVELDPIKFKPTSLVSFEVRCSYLAFED
jgi:hypothetical protein